MKWLKNLKFIFMPSYWLMNHPYNKEVDMMINGLLDDYEFTNIGEYDAKLGATTIWIENHPYASMRLYNSNLIMFRPSRLTIRRAYIKLNAARVKEVKKRVAEFLKEHKLPVSPEL